MVTNTAIKKIPYGMTDFESIICDNYYYVDKTHFIALVEQSKQYTRIYRRRSTHKSFHTRLSGAEQLLYRPPRIWKQQRICRYLSATSFVTASRHDVQLLHRSKICQTWCWRYGNRKIDGWCQEATKTVCSKWMDPARQRNYRIEEYSFGV